MTALPDSLPRRMTLGEYLAFEEMADWKHEFHPDPDNEPSCDVAHLRGEVLAMSGASYPHVRVTTNLTASLVNRLRGGPCVPLMNDMRVATNRRGRFGYPDATVVCEEPRFHPDFKKPPTLMNPRVIFEVLSDSTERYDRTEKFDHYRQMESFQEYFLVDQHRPRVEGYLRLDDGTWSLATWDGLHAVARLRSLDLDLPLAEVYEGVSFEDAASADQEPGGDQE